MVKVITLSPEDGLHWRRARLCWGRARYIHTHRNTHTNMYICMYIHRGSKDGMVETVAMK